MKKTSKWPSRAFNLLMVLAMVISLSAILVAPSTIAAAQEVCSPTPIYAGCHLDVAVATYIKDTDGNFIPQSSFSPDDCFYVNAVVVNDGNSTAPAPITATLNLQSGTEVGQGEPGEFTLQSIKTSLVDLQGNVTTTNPHRMADFWWKVCCTLANGNDTIAVNVTAGSLDPPPVCSGEGSTVVFQGTSPQFKCIDLEIVEAPGMGNKTGHLGNYFQTMPGTVNPCQNFGIKAEITNNCDVEKYIGNVTISWDPNLASLVGGDPNSWDVGTLLPGQTVAVGWTLHCDGPGDVAVTVTDTNQVGQTNFIDDPWTVHQATPGGLVVVITNPQTPIGCDGSPVEIKQPSGDCANVSNFPVTAIVTNTGDSTVVGVNTIASASRPNWVTISNPVIGQFILGPGASHTVNFSAKCIGTGLGNITVNASGTDSGSGLTVSAAPKNVEIDQKLVIAQKTPDITPSPFVNKCDPKGFDVSFRYTNYSNEAWVAPGDGNITACIYWVGNVTLTGNVTYRRVTGGIEESWQLLDGNATDQGNFSCENVLTNIPQIPAICSCCAFDVRWHFTCNDVGPTSFYSTINVQQIHPLPDGFNGNDTSEPVCITQQWKAHLISDVFFFVQNTNRVMIEQDAIVPGTNFHVVIPVINTGDAAAQNVQVYFVITADVPEGAPCTTSYQFVSYSGDGHLETGYPITNGLQQTYIADLGNIPGHTAKKAILQLDCVCEGHVSVWIINDVPNGPGGVPIPNFTGLQGVRGIDANTGTWVPQANILIPPCPLVLEQMPFSIELENPYTCQTFTQGTSFPVKAKITNGSADENLGNVSAYLYIYGPAQLVSTQNNPKFVGNVTAGSSSEITWELVCTGGGDVYLGVYATAVTPLLSVYTDSYPDTVVVHQIAVPTACLQVTILSPGANTYIATGQQFAVSAKVYNSGPADATNVTATIDGCPYSLHYVTPVGNTDVSLGTIDAYDFQVITWTLYGGSDADYWMKDCNKVNDTICVNATTDTLLGTNCNGGSDSVEVSIYPAAFLVTSIENVTPDSFNVGGLVTVDYRITNYGVADATSVLANLSVSPAAAAVIAQTPDNMPRTIPGWSWGSPFNYIEGSFTLRCMQDSPFTVTIAPSGDDECGWQPKDPLLVDGIGFVWVNLPLSPIQSRFLGYASVTLEPGVTAGAGCPDLTSMNITLNSGWNLISLPLIPDNGNVSALFSGKGVDAVWAYSGGAWSSPTTLADGQGYWAHRTAAGTVTVTVTGKVNPLPPQTPPTYTVAAGWNLMGFKSTCARTASAYLGGVPWIRIWGYANGWVLVQSGDMLQPGYGYWIAATGAGTIFP